MKFTTLSQKTATKTTTYFFEEVQEDGSTSALEKGIMGFMFNGDNKTWWLYNKKSTSS